MVNFSWHTKIKIMKKHTKYNISKLVTSTSKIAPLEPKNKTIF